MEQDQHRKSIQQGLLSQKSVSKSGQVSYKQKYIKANHQLLYGNIFGLIFFKWISPLLRYGNKIPISEDVIPTLRQEHNVMHDFTQLDKKFRGAKKSSIKGLTLTKALAVTFGKTLLKIGIFVFMVVSLQMYSPLLTNQIMDFIKEESDKRDQARGIMLFVVVCLVMLIKCISENHMYFNFGLLGYNSSNTINLMIYTKSLKYPALCQKKHTIAEIINYTQVDAQRLTDIGFYMSMLFLAPIEMAIGIYLMVSFLGVAFLSGIAVMVVVTILTFFIEKYAAKVNDKLLKAKDARLKLTQQVFNIIRFVKTNAMEKYFFRKVDRKRVAELKLNKSNQMMYVLMYLVYFATSPLVMSLTFATFTWMGNQMTSNVAFTTLLIFRLLQFPMTIFPIAIGELIQIWSSMKRVQDFLLADQVSFDCISYKENNPKQKHAIKITNGTFQWGLQQKKEEQESKKQENHETKKVIQSEQKLRESLISQDMQENSVISIQAQEKDKKLAQEKPKTITALYDINLQLPKCKFTMILGDIGSGKSSLLYAILNEMQPVEKKEARVQVNGTLAFVSQKAWIMSSSVKDNITFKLPYSAQRFQRAIQYASLQKDVQGMTDGIDTQIGEKGVNLSGGQKARISLARALYSDRDIYLLDDVISAVDVHVGRFLMKQTILQFLRGKTVILATHAISFAQYADQILIMKKGKVVQQGSYRQVAATDEFRQLNQIQSQRERKKSEQKQEQEQKDQDAMDNLAKKISKNNSKPTEKIKSTQKIQLLKQNIQSQTQKLVYELMLPEQQNKGSVQLKVYKSYVKLNGGVFFVVGLLICLTTWVVLYSLSNIEMEQWCEDPEGSQYHLYLFLAFSLSAAGFAFFRILILVLAGLKQSTTIHKKMIKALLYASIPDFYNRVPVGRIINRLTKDLRVIDENLSYTVQGFIGSAFSLFGSFVICVYASSPYLMILIAFMIASCVYIKRYYMKTQRQIVRLESISNSPVVSGLMSTVNGLAVIRSYNLQGQFIEEQVKKINRNKQIRVSKDSLEGWFAQRLSLLSFVVNTAAIAFCLLSTNQNASLAGLLMSYAITLNDDIIGVMFCLAGVETQMVSYQRIINFIEIEPEPGYIEYCKNWRTGEQQRDIQAIQKGKIRFQNYGIKYREDLPFVLRNISLSIKEGEKVGIVGRTGAGKSTVVSCLLRILEPSEGRIFIDDRNIMDYHLRDLRTCITMIEQQPTLINGTFKENLDPSHTYSTEQLNDIVKQCNLEETISERGGLESQISNDSLSVGEKQLLCICRAFLKKSKIVLIDEATANIDMKNDALIQEVIQKNFTESTVLTIAHRLSTLKNVDKILVLGEGKVLEWGTPKDLLGKQDGIYRAMIDSHNEDFLK